MNVSELIKKKYSGRSEQELLEVIEKQVARINKLELYFFGSRKERYEADPEGMELLEKFFGWLEKHRDQITPNSPTGKAISYALSNWEKLTFFSRDGRVPIDNNYLERYIRPFAVGRQAWMFAAVQAGAHASATLYSLVESAKANGIEPFDYLNLIFKELPAAKELHMLEKLLPYRAAQHYQLRPYNSARD